MARKRLDGDLQTVATVLASADAAAERVPGALKAYRAAHGLTQEALAALLGVSRVTVARVEAGLRRPSAHLLLAIVRHGGIK